MKFLRTLMVLALTAGVLGCGDNEGKSKVVGGNTYTSDSNTGGIPLGEDGSGLGGGAPADFTGTWTGTLTVTQTAPNACSTLPTVTDSKPFTVVATQSGNTVTGTSQWDTDPPNPFTGTVSGNVLTVNEPDTCGTSTAVVNWTVTLNSATQSVLALSGDGCYGCGGSAGDVPSPATGTATLARQ